MKRRIMAVVLSIAILFSDSASVFACDRKQTETYVSQMLFGDKAEKYKSNEKVQMLMKALYLCSEQYDEMNKQLDILFKDQKKSKKTNDYNRMMSAIDENIRKVRNVGNKGETAGKQYILCREYEYEYYKILRKYLPSLLEQEQFFSNVFRD